MIKRLCQYFMYFMVFQASVAFATLGGFSLPDAGSPQLISLYIPLHFAHAKTMAALITKKGLLTSSKGAFVLGDQRTNILWVRGLAKTVKQIKGLARQLDVPSKQVLVKVKILSVDTHSLKELGVQFMSQARQAAGQVGIGHVVLPVSRLSSAEQLSAKLLALEKNGQVKIISTPELMASNRESAFIESGEDIPYQQEAESGGTTVAFKRASLKLTVTPTVLPHQCVLLNIYLTQDRVSNTLIKGAPAIKTQALKTQVLLRDKQTVVLGGIYETHNATKTQGVPVLDSLPILGLLFQSHYTQHTRRELLVFVTPYLTP